MHLRTRASSRSIGFSQKIFLPAFAALNEIGMHIGRRGDEDRVDVVGVDDLIDAADTCARGLGNGLGRGRQRIGDRNELCACGGGDCPGVHLADAACAEKSDT